MRRMINAAFLAFLCFSLPACTSTVIPKVVHSSAPSADGNDFNSGVIAFLQDGSVLVTESWVQRYLVLATKYGDRIALSQNPIGGKVVVQENGVSKAGYAATAQAVEDFETMNRWRKAGVPPRVIKP